ncbi:unnamed protein product [Dicrocoelium dendriticum]|nr:unnamed protein product [Dicrocoelium dendriticum]
MWVSLEYLSCYFPEGTDKFLPILNQTISHNLGSSDAASKYLFSTILPCPDDTKGSPQPSAPSLVDGNKQTLRVSSSVPDLTVTLRQMSKRTDIRDFDWNTGTSNGDVTLHTKGRRKLERESIEREQLERVFRQLHSVQKRPPKKRADTKRFPARTPKRTALLPISDNEEVVAELSQLSPDSLPDKVGNNLLSSNGHLGKRSTSMLHDGQNAALLPIKRSSRAASGHGRRATSLSDSDADAVSLCEPGHLRYRMARCASDLMISRKASRLLEMNPNLLTSFFQTIAEWVMIACVHQTI